MFRIDVISKVAKEAGVKKEVAESVMEAFEKVVAETMKTTTNDKEKISFGDIGYFKVKRVKERKGTIMMGPKSGTDWTTPAHSKVYFDVNDDFKYF